MTQTNESAARDDGAPIRFDIDFAKLAKRVLLFCVVVELSFVFLDYHFYYGRAIDIDAVRYMFSASREDGLASWFAATQTLFIGMTLWVMYACIRQTAPKWRTTGWLVIAAFFSYMAVDDAAQIHERIGTTFADVIDRLEIAHDFFPSYYWQLLLLPVFASLGLFTFGFLWCELGENKSRAILVAAFFCLALAVAMDFVEGLHEEHPVNIYARLSHTEGLGAWTEMRFGKDPLTTIVHFSKSVEEAIEMFAHSLLWFLLLTHLGAVVHGVLIRSVSREPAARHSST